MAAHPRSRALLAVAAMLAGLAVSAAPAAAVEPVDLPDEDAMWRAWPPLNQPAVVAPPPAPATSSPTPASTPDDPTPEIGLDVSYPQCDHDLPEEGDFAIVGVNGGRVYSPNPCLAPAAGAAGQLAWAGPEVELYANTGNPGPWLSRYWPGMRVDAEGCRADGYFGSADTVACAYRYGWNAAADSYRTALEAFVAVGWADEDDEALPWATTWWLDVEVANSWRFDRRLNVATLEGARDYLESMEVAEVGFYSTPRMWARIVGDADVFADHPAWHAGASNLEDALERCSEEPAFTGGELRMVQWVEDGLDHNVRCEIEGQGQS